MLTWMFGEMFPDFMDALVPVASQPGPMSGRNWIQRRINVEAIRNDPEWNERRLRDAADQLGAGGAALRADDAERRPHPGAGADAREGRCALSSSSSSGRRRPMPTTGSFRSNRQWTTTHQRISRRSKRGSSPSTSPTMRSIRPSWACWRPALRGFPARVRSWCRPGQRARATTPRCARRSGRAIWPIFWGQSVG